MNEVEAKIRQGNDRAVKNHVLVAKTKLVEVVARLNHSQVIYRCREVSIALTHIETSILWLENRFNQNLTLYVEGDEE